MTPEQLAEIHAAAFTNTRAWSAAEFKELLDSSGCFLVRKQQGFALGRCVGTDEGAECELIMIAVDPSSQRMGLGRAILSQFEQEAILRNASEVFLEVASTNTAATQLYEKSGYRAIAARKSYYKNADGSKADALIMSKALRTA